MVPSIVIYYLHQRSNDSPIEKIAKAAFVNESDALIFWKALDEKRKRFMLMETVDGKPVKEIAHTGYTESYGGRYSHAYALTESDLLPPRVRDRESAVKVGWEFERVNEEQ